MDADRLHQRLAALEAAPRLSIAYKATISFWDRDGGMKHEVVGFYVEKNDADREATAAIERKQAAPGFVRGTPSRHVVEPFLIVTWGDGITCTINCGEPVTLVR